MWKTRFLSTGGLAHFLNVLMTTNFFDPSKGSKRKECLTLLLQLTNFFVLTRKSVTFEDPLMPYVEEEKPVKVCEEKIVCVCV